MANKVLNLFVTIQVGTEVQSEMKTYRDLQIGKKTLCLCAFAPLNLSSYYNFQPSGRRIIIL
ncbi:hypothetical protein HY00_10860 [Peptococcaceae bacterium SCADC1_2_3]|nr:hypothetical protein HY00_10860 [Peptococcaceae bacterium SCADC1_2_3]